MGKGGSHFAPLGSSTAQATHIMREQKLRDPLYSESRNCVPSKTLIFNMTFLQARTSSWKPLATLRMQRVESFTVNAEDFFVPLFVAEELKHPVFTIICGGGIKTSCFEK